MKRRLALLTAIFMLISSLSVFAEGFSDMPAQDSKYYKAFEYAITQKLITGDGGKLNPDAPVTKAEALTFISRAKPFGENTADMTKIVDVKPADWYYNTMSKAVAASLVTPDAEGKVYPTQALTRRQAWDMLNKAFATTTYIPVTEGEKTATRADFVLWLYELSNASQSVENGTTVPTEPATEAPTEGSGAEYSDIKAQKALEDMQVALGILPDGTSYTNTAVYRDDSQTGWATGQTSGSSSRPSGGGSNRPSDDDDDQPTEDTNTPTEDTNNPSDNPTTPTEPETQAPTEEPTYDDYDGPIDNDKDNVIDDPFDDGWTPPGSGGDTDDDDDSSGSGGWDEEDDFIINDDDDPDYVPDEPDEDETQEPTDEETDEPSDAPTDEVTDEPSDNPTDEVTDEPSDNPTDEATDEPSDNPTDEEADEPTNTPEGDTDDPALPPTDEETEGDEPAGDDDSDAEGDNNNDAALLSKDWWLD